jgi:hypothetical protein
MPKAMSSPLYLTYQSYFFSRRSISTLMFQRASLVILEQTRSGAMDGIRYFPHLRFQMNQVLSLSLSLACFSLLRLMLVSSKSGKNHCVLVLSPPERVDDILER